MYTEGVVGEVDRRPSRGGPPSRRSAAGPRAVANAEIDGAGGPPRRSDHRLGPAWLTVLSRPDPMRQTTVAAVQMVGHVVAEHDSSGQRALGRRRCGWPPGRPGRREEAVGPIVFRRRSPGRPLRCRHRRWHRQSRQTQPPSSAEGPRRRRFPRRSGHVSVIVAAENARSDRLEAASAAPSSVAQRQPEVKRTATWTDVGRQGDSRERTTC